MFRWCFKVYMESAFSFNPHNDPVRWAVWVMVHKCGVEGTEQCKKQSTVLTDAVNVRNNDQECPSVWFFQEGWEQGVAHQPPECFSWYCRASPAPMYRGDHGAVLGLVGEDVDSAPFACSHNPCCELCLYHSPPQERAWRDAVGSLLLACGFTVAYLVGSVQPTVRIQWSGASVAPHTVWKLTSNISLENQQKC